LITLYALRRILFSTRSAKLATVGFIFRESLQVIVSFKKQENLVGRLGWDLSVKVISLETEAFGGRKLKY